MRFFTGARARLRAISEASGRQISRAVWRFARLYLVAAALVLALAFSFFEVYVLGVGPVPQQPPEGYVVERAKAVLQWNRGTRSGKITLQVSRDKPDFSKLEVKKDLGGKTYTMSNLVPGHTYYWRLVQDGKASPVATFKTSPYALNF